MSNDTVQATSQPVEAPSAPETKSDAAKPGNLTVAEAAQRLLNMEAENAKAQAAVAEQNSPESSTSAPEEASAESAEAEPQAEAQAIFAEDLAANKAMGACGAALIADGAPQRVRLFGENYVAFRDTHGEPSFLDEAWSEQALEQGVR